MLSPNFHSLSTCASKSYQVLWFLQRGSILVVREVAAVLQQVEDLALSLWQQGFLPSGVRIWHCCSCGLGCGGGSDMIPGLKLPYDAGLEKKKKGEGCRACKIRGGGCNHWRVEVGAFCSCVQGGPTPCPCPVAIFSASAQLEKRGLSQFFASFLFLFF